MSSLINRKAARERTLAIVRNERNGRFTRVSPEFLERAEAALNQWIWAEVRKHPSKGVTLK